MAANLTIFFICILVFAYGGYVLPAWLWMKMSPTKKRVKSKELPTVTFIVAAYNEEEIIEEKINNCLNLTYPEDKISFLFVTDGSTDETAKIIKSYPNIQLQNHAIRDGKSMAINRAMQIINAEIVIFSDANTMLNEQAVMHIAEAFLDPGVGGVAGEKKVFRIEKGGANTDGEGLYWQYESWLKNFDASFYSTVGAAGELFAIRSALYVHTPREVLLDDFIISMKICLKGWKIAYTKKAVASEYPSENLKEEKKRKKRIATGAFQSVFLLKELLYFWKYPRLTYLYISHRMLRWIICPFLLPAIFIGNLVALNQQPDLVIYVLFYAQCGFYLLALTGAWLNAQNLKHPIFSIPLYFIFMNLNMYIGLFQYLKTTPTGTWEKAARLKKGISSNY
jgi:cellulose synthase/poly-beta-1,6-N-acetylglucosamine synthase-like glycosyltransferase